MKVRKHNGGFSLSEVLMAVGILAIGLVFIASTFPVGISLTATCVERTTGAVAADEAFAKIRLYGIYEGEDPDDPNLPPVGGGHVPYEVVADPDWLVDTAVGRREQLEEFARYPSVALERHQYYWSAVCRRVDSRAQPLVQVTVFVGRKTAPFVEYFYPTNPGDVSSWPRPVKLPWSAAARVWHLAAWANNVIAIRPGLEDAVVVPGSVILDDETGYLYRVTDVERDPRIGDIVTLDRGWAGGFGPRAELTIWVVPPATGGSGRDPCVGVYQREIRVRP